MALDFPTATSVGQIHTENGYRFSWDGSKWQSVQGELIVDLSASSITGTLDVDHGGTGQTSFTPGVSLGLAIALG